MRETRAACQKRTMEIIRRLKKITPNRTIELDFKTPMQLLVATILSAQCTDKRVNIVTKSLFKKYKTPKDFAAATLSTLEKEIHSTGFYRAKAKNIKACAQAIVSRFKGKLPNRIDQLTTLAGVGRKTANVVLGNLHGIPGIVVDTHVKRISNLLGLTKQQNPVKIETDLEKILPQPEWVEFSHLLIKHGRKTCIARRPRCHQCTLQDICPSGH